MTKINPLHNYVLIKRDEETLHTSGIIRVGEENERQHRGVVIAVGHGRRENGQLIPTQVKVGDRVLLDTWAMVKIDGEDYYMAIEDAIIGVIE